MNQGNFFGSMLSNMMMSRLQNNPLFMQAQQMAQGKSPDELRKTCENLCRQRGIDFNQALNQFQSQFPGLR